MEQRPSRRQTKTRGSVRSSSTDLYGVDMNMPQSMMVLSEADEQRRRRNTILLDNYKKDDLVGDIEGRDRGLSNTLPIRSHEDQLLLQETTDEKRIE